MSNRTEQLDREQVGALLRPFFNAENPVPMSPVEPHHVHNDLLPFYDRIGDLTAYPVSLIGSFAVQWDNEGELEDFVRPVYPSANVVAGQPIVKKPDVLNLGLLRKDFGEVIEVVTPGTTPYPRTLGWQLQFDKHLFSIQTTSLSEDSSLFVSPEEVKIMAHHYEFDIQGAVLRHEPLDPGSLVVSAIHSIAHRLRRNDVARQNIKAIDSRRQSFKKSSLGLAPPEELSIKQLKIRKQIEDLSLPEFPIRVDPSAKPSVSIDGPVPYQAEATFRTLQSVNPDADYGYEAKPQ